MSKFLAFVALFAFASSTAIAAAPFPHYVYTNDNQTSNTVTTLSVDSTGTLTNLGQTSTGGTGGLCNGGGYYAANRIRAQLVKHTDDLLLAANQCDPSVTIFSGASTGNLAIQSIVPVDAQGDMSIASNGTCIVFALSTGEVDAYLYPNMTTIAGQAFVPAAPDGMQISKHNDVVIADIGSSAVSVIPLSSKCALGSISTIATANTGAGNGPANVAFSPNGKIMYVADANFGQTIVEAFNFPEGTALPGSPFIYNVGSNSNVVLAIKTCLFVSNQASGTVTAIPLGYGVPETAATAYSSGSYGGSPTGMAADPSGKMFFVAGYSDNTVTTELIGRKCALVEPPNSPLATGVSGGTLESIAVY